MQTDLTYKILSMKSLQTTAAWTEATFNKAVASGSTNQGSSASTSSDLSPTMSSIPSPAIQPEPDVVPSAHQSDKSHRANTNDGDDNDSTFGIEHFIHDMTYKLVRKKSDPNTQHIVY